MKIEYVMKQKRGSLLLLSWNPLIKNANEKPSFYGLELLLEAILHLQLQTIVVTYVIIITTIILGFIFSLTKLVYLCWCIVISKKYQTNTHVGACIYDPWDR